MITKEKIANLFVLFLLLFLCFTLFSCDNEETDTSDDKHNDDDDDNDDSDDDEDDDNDTEPDCSENHPPVIHTPILGILMPNGYTYMPGIIIKGKDELIFTNRYWDEDCNLSGGTVRNRISSATFSGYEIPEHDQITCGWDFGGNYMVIRLGSTEVTGYLSTTKDYLAEVYYVDACGGESEILQMPFNVFELPDKPGQELVSNGGFEEGAAGWEAHSLLGYTVINRDTLNTMPINPRTGQYAGWMGGYSKGRDLLLQQVEFPEQVQMGFFEAWIYAATWDFDQENGDLLEISLVDQLGKKTHLSSLYDREAFHQYAALRAIIDEETAAELSGSPYWLSIEYVDDQDNHSTWFILDDISLKVWTEDKSRNGKMSEVNSEKAIYLKEANENQEIKILNTGNVSAPLLFSTGTNSKSNGKEEEDCEDNLPPSLSIIGFENDGIPLHEPFFAIKDEDTEVFFQWEDPECEMGGGGVYFSIWPYLWEYAYQFPEWEEHGCSGKFSIVYDTWIQRDSELFFLLEDECGEVDDYVFFKHCNVLLPEEDSRADALTNGGFEMGGNGWDVTGSGTVDFSSIPDKSRIGSGTAIIKGNSVDTVTISQSTEIPDGNKLAVFAFWLKIITESASDSAMDTLSVEIEGDPSPLAEFANVPADDFPSDWRYYYYDISERVGDTLEIKFMFDFDLDNVTEFRLDAITIRYD